MGNTKFKLSDIIPNAWFYILKDMNKSSNKLSRKNHPSPPPAPPSSPPFKTPPAQPKSECEVGRKSYHITRELPLSPPRKSKSSSSKSRKSTKRSSSISSCSCKSTTTSHSHRSKPFSYPSSPPLLKETDKNVGFFVEDALLTSHLAKQSILEDALSNPKYNKDSTEHLDIIIDVDEKSLRTNNQNNNINKFNFPLAPINTKQQTKPRISNKENTLKPSKPRIFKENKHSPPSWKRFSVSSPGGIRLKLNSPRVTGRKQGQIGKPISGGRRSTSYEKTKKSIAESFAVVKSSRNPQKDFKESMVEMIVQNNIRASKDLEDLLACYLSLNSDEYHEVIIKVFKQVWFDLRHYK